METFLMTEEPALEMLLYTLCLEDTAVAVCAIPLSLLEENLEKAVRDALFETWRFGGGDLGQLVGRAIRARPPTKKEGKMWHAIAGATGKPYVVLGGAPSAKLN
jgi:hypothetical protein